MPGGSAWPRKVFRAAKPRGEFCWSSGGSGGMLPKKIFKIKGPRLAKNAFSRFQLGKLDKNESARSLALKFGL